MNIGIIVHSKTGITAQFGKQIANKLRGYGHVVEMIELQTDVPVNSGSVRRTKPFAITNLPDCQKFDAMLIGGPVWAFSASPVLIACLQRLQGIAGKKMLPFVTMGFTFPSMGGTQAIDLMNRTVKQAGAMVLPGKIVPGLFRNRDLLMKQAIEDIAACFV